MQKQLERFARVLILLTLVMSVTEQLWFAFRGLVYEPAGNPVQTLILGMPFWLRLIILDPLDGMMYAQWGLFWLGVAILIWRWVERKRRI